LQKVMTKHKIDGESISEGKKIKPFTQHIRNMLTALFNLFNLFP
jgi:hypothetical protein